MALATLAPLVEAGYDHFDAAAWVLVAAVLITYVAVWTEYVQAIATYVWLPNLTDAVVPFAIATLDLFLAHFAVRGAACARGYLLVQVVTSFAGAGAFVQLALRAGAPRAEADNRDVHRTLDRHRAVRIAHNVVSGVLLLAAWAVYDAGGRGITRLLWRWRSRS